MCSVRCSLKPLVKSAPPEGVKNYIFRSREKRHPRESQNLTSAKPPCQTALTKNCLKDVRRHVFLRTKPAFERCRKGCEFPWQRLFLPKSPYFCQNIEVSVFCFFLICFIFTRVLSFFSQFPKCPFLGQNIEVSVFCFFLTCLNFSRDLKKCQAYTHFSTITPPKSRPVKTQKT